MKVLILHSELGNLRGGGENFVKNLFIEFASRGNEVHAVFAADAAGRYPVALPETFHPIPLPGWWCRQLGQSWLSTISSMIPHDSGLRPVWDRIHSSIVWRNFRWFNERFAKRVRTLFQDRWEIYDLVFVNSLEMGLLAAAMRPTMLWLAGPLSREIEAQLRSIPVVSADGDAFLRMKAFLGDHITELSIGLDGERFQPGAETMRASLGWNEDHCVFGYVGRLTQLKGADILASAFAEIARAQPRARLLIVGNGESERSVRSALQAQVDAGHVVFQYGVDHAELPRWYRAMDVLLLPSRYENFSNALVEAAACGVPFIASNVGGNRILHRKGGSGELFEAGSVGDMARCMNEFIASPQPKRDKAIAFSRVVRDSYSWKASADRLEWILQTRLGITAPGQPAPQTAAEVRSS